MTIHGGWLAIPSTPLGAVPDLRVTNGLFHKYILPANFTSFIPLKILDYDILISKM